MKGKVILALIIVGCLSAFLTHRITHSVATDTVDSKLAVDMNGTGDGYIATALHFMQKGTFAYEQFPFYFGAVPTGPLYPAFIAGSFFLFGTRLSSLWFMQLICYIGAILLLYRLSGAFLNERWSPVPPFLLAVFWGAAVYVYGFNNEVLSLLIIVYFALSLVWYYKAPEKSRYIVLASLLFSLFILGKPIFEYFFPLLLFLLVWQGFLLQVPVKKLIQQGSLALLVFLIVVGSWHIRNERLFGNPSIAPGSHAFFLRALSATYATPTMKGFIIASFAGDYTANVVVPGYASLPEPATSIRTMFNRYRMELKQIIPSEYDVDKIFFDEATALYSAHPIVYWLLTPIWFLRMNGVPYYTGGAIDHLLVDTHTTLSPWIKIGLLLGIHLLWFALIGFIFWQIIKTIRVYNKTPHALVIISMFVLYTNLIYTGFAHAEVRYALPIMPFYFIFLTKGVQDCFSLYGKNIRRIIP